MNYSSIGLFWVVENRDIYSTGYLIDVIPSFGQDGPVGGIHLLIVPVVGRVLGKSEVNSEIIQVFRGRRVFPDTPTTQSRTDGKFSLLWENRNGCYLLCQFWGEIRTMFLEVREAPIL